MTAWLAATISGAAGFGGALLLLPVLAYAVGPKAAVPILTLAQLLGNLSRAGFGVREIRWRPVGWFALGAVPACVAGARLFVALPAGVLDRGVGLFLLGMVALRHTRFGRVPMSEFWLVPAGAVAGFLSAMVGSAGPLAAAFFLGLQLPPVAYVASEAVAATLMHATKTVVYGRFALLPPHDLALGLLMGGAMVLGSWTGLRLVEGPLRRWFGPIVEVLLVVSAVVLLVGNT